MILLSDQMLDGESHNMQHIPEHLSIAITPKPKSSCSKEYTSNSCSACSRENTQLLIITKELYMHNIVNTSVLVSV